MGNESEMNGFGSDERFEAMSVDEAQEILREWPNQRHRSASSQDISTHEVAAALGVTDREISRALADIRERRRQSTLVRPPKFLDSASALSLAITGVVVAFGFMMFSVHHTLRGPNIVETRVAPARILYPPPSPSVQTDWSKDGNVIYIPPRNHFNEDPPVTNAAPAPDGQPDVQPISGTSDVTVIEG